MKNQKGSALVWVIVIVIILIVVGFLFLRFSKNSDTQTAAPAEKVVVFDDSDVKVSPSVIAPGANSLDAFMTLGKNPITAVENVFLSQYIGTTTSKLPPVAPSQKILVAHADMLKVFDENADKEYACLFAEGVVCPLSQIRDVGRLAALRSLVQMQQGKSAQAQAGGWNIVKFGQHVGKNPDSVITLLISWVLQSMGYDTVLATNPKGKFTDAARLELITTMKDGQKTALKSDYQHFVRMIDYITNPSSVQLPPDQKEIADVYLKEAGSSATAWNGPETKKYFYDSLKIQLSNIDKGCGVALIDSKADTHFDSASTDKSVENYVGKTLYNQGNVSLNSLNERRCTLLEAKINKL